MRLNSIAAFIVGGALTAHCHSDHGNVDESRLEELKAKWGTDWSFTGISTFAHLPHTNCLLDPSLEFDIGVIGAPFDTAVSYRPGARFGPRAIRSSSARQISFRSFNARAGINPYTSWARIVDCGDIPVSPFDNALALRQLQEAYTELGSRKIATKEAAASYQGKSRLITLGGDHSVALPALRALKERHGQAITVLHFDAHLDTWHPGKYPSAWTDAGEEFTQSFFNHGSVFWLAGTEGLIANGSVHAGLRTRLSGNDFTDYEDDTQQGWYRIPADEIDDVGVKTVIERIVNHIGTERPVYISVDIDVIDPGMAPATGTPEPGGWTTREMIRILRGIEDLNVVGADIVEVSPAYDDAGESTSLAAAQVAFEIITSMVKRGVKDAGKAKEALGDGKDEL